MDIRRKRAHDEWRISDGYRALIDRLWPRGVSKTDDRGKLTLVHSARDEEHHDAVVPAQPLRRGRRSR